MVLGVSTRVQTTITGATGYTVGVAAEAARYGNTNGITVGSTTNPIWNSATEINPRLYVAATDIVVTAKTSNFTGGTLRIIVSYIDFGLPTS